MSSHLPGKHGGSVALAIIDAMEARLTRRVLESLVLPNVQKVSGIIERKICAVGLIRLLTETPGLLTPDYLPLFIPILSTCLLIVLMVLMVFFFFQLQSFVSLRMQCRHMTQLKTAQRFAFYYFISFISSYFLAVCWNRRGARLQCSLFASCVRLQGRRWPLQRNSICQSLSRNVARSSLFSTPRSIRSTHRCKPRCSISRLPRTISPCCTTPSCCDSLNDCLTHWIHPFKCKFDRE